MYLRGLKSVMLLVLFGCVSENATEYTLPNEKRSSVNLTLDVPKGSNQVVNFQGFNLTVSPSGPVVFNSIPICEAAKIVLEKSLSLDFTCSASGMISMSFPHGGSSVILQGFIAAVRRSGAVILVRNDVVIITKGRAKLRSHAQEGRPPVGLSGSEKFKGGYVRGDLPKEFEKRLRTERVNISGSVIRSLPSNVNIDEASETADLLGVDVSLAEIKGKPVVMGSESDVTALMAALSVSSVIAVPIRVSILDKSIIDGFQVLYPALLFIYDDAARILWLRGQKNEVLTAYYTLAKTLPNLNDIQVKVTFVSYTKSNGKSASANVKFSIPFGSGFITSGAILDGYQFKVDLKSLVDSGSGSILSQPSIRVVNGKTAKFTNGESVPILTEVTEEGSESFEYRDVGIVLTVTPRRISKETVVLNIETEISSVDGVSVGGNPTFRIRNVQTEVILNTGDVVAISGLDYKSQDFSNSKSFGIFGNKSKKVIDSSIAFFVSAS